MKLKFSVSISPSAADDELLFVKQLGAECVYTWVPESHMDVASLTELRQKVDDAGLVRPVRFVARKSMFAQPLIQDFYQAVSKRARAV